MDSRLPYHDDDVDSGRQIPNSLLLQFPDPWLIVDEPVADPRPPTPRVNELENDSDDDLLEGLVDVPLADDEFDIDDELDVARKNMKDYLDRKRKLCDEDNAEELLIFLNQLLIFYAYSVKKMENSKGSKSTEVTKGFVTRISILNA
ncbi:hypothetical protein DITRI_Ditri10aG0088600 [Diplodiscus trichospermus]